MSTEHHSEILKDGIPLTTHHRYLLHTVYKEHHGTAQPEKWRAVNTGKGDGPIGPPPLHTSSILTPRPCHGLTITSALAQVGVQVVL